MRIKAMLLASALFAPVALAQSGAYQDGTFLGFKSIPNGTNVNPITGDTYNQSSQAFVVQVGDFQYFLLKEGTTTLMRSPFSRAFSHEDMFLNNAQPGSVLHVRLGSTNGYGDRKLYVQEGSKEHGYWVKSVVPAAAPSPSHAEPAPSPVQRTQQAPQPGPGRSPEAAGFSEGGYRPQFDDCLRHSSGDQNMMLQCGATEQAYQDGKLNGVYQQLLAMGNAQAQQQTRQEERQWMANRDRKCAGPAGTGADPAIGRPACILEETKNQANRLQGQLDATKH